MMIEPGAVTANRRWSKARRIGVTALVVASAALTLVAADLLFHLRPIAAEKFWLAALASGITPLQEEAVRNLRDHPTRAAAASLVAFINHRSRAGDFEQARHATATLSALSGRTFGNEAEWPEVLARINHWAERALRLPR